MDFENPFKDSFFGDPFEVDVWDDKDGSAAFNPFGNPRDDTETTEDISTSEASSNFSLKPHQRDHTRPSGHRSEMNRRHSFKTTRRASRQDLLQDDEVDTAQHHQQKSTDHHHHHSRSQKSHGVASENKEDAVRVGKDRRPRIVRNPSNSAKQPTRRRSTQLQGKETSMRNLVSLLNGSDDTSLGDGSNDAGTIAASTITSRSERTNMSHETQSEQTEASIDSVKSPSNRSKTPTRSLQRTPSMRLRRALKANLTSELKQGGSPQAEDQSSGMTPTRGLQRTPSTRSRRGMRESPDDTKKRAVDQACPEASATTLNAAQGPSVPTRGLQRSASLRSRRNVRSTSTDKAEGPSTEDVASPNRGIQRSNSMRRRPPERSHSSRGVPPRSRSGRLTAVRKTRSGDAALGDMATAASALAAVQNGTNSTATSAGSISSGTHGRRAPLPSKSGQSLQRMSRGQRMASARSFISDDAP